MSSGGQEVDKNKIKSNISVLVDSCEWYGSPKEEQMTGNGGVW